MIINDNIFKEILEKELEKYIYNKIFDDEIDYVSQRNAFRAGFKAAILNLDKLVQNSKLN